MGHPRASRWLLAGSVLAVASAAEAAETTTYTYDPLGRLTATSSSGGPASGVNSSYGYDCAGNRIQVLTGSAAPVPPPPPCASAGPPPPGNNQPPTANPDTAPSIPKCGSTTVNVTANDSDPEGHLPLVVTGVGTAAGLSLTVINASTIGIESLGPSGLKTFTYTVRDSLGATSTGNVSVTVTTAGACS